MAEGSYFDYHSGLGQASLSHIPSFSGRPDTSNYDGDGKTGPGFYTEQFQSLSTGLPGGEMMPQGGEHDMSHMMMSGQPPEAMYEAHYRGYMKPEKGLPPTPPGSPDEPKVMPGLNGGLQAGPSHMPGHLGPVSHPGLPSMQQHYINKPLPVRRLSEKRMSQNRACINSVTSAMMASDQLNEPGFSPSNPALARALASVQHAQKRPRGEKKAMPHDAKDDRYFERRKRNNSAAKKSRDARKSREDEIAIRASYLEKENAVLRAQVATLRDEANSLRQLLLQKRPRP